MKQSLNRTWLCHQDSAKILDQNLETRLCWDTGSKCGGRQGEPGVGSWRYE